jgi:hypothetical protein
MPGGFQTTSTLPSWLLEDLLTSCHWLLRLSRWPMGDASLYTAIHDASNGDHGLVTM